MVKSNQMWTDKQAITMQTLSIKQEAIDTIASLPNTVDMEEIIYRLYVLNQIRQGLDDIAQGQSIPHDELLQEVAQW